ncbi:AzlD domain-containing protein [Campylobacter sp. 9BO]|uniref:branched-chain amino acid transporter permease n=1 Tax=Campylobacter sp. 9BO TaxID=3424759 RepID=UPI003D352E2B
MISVSSPEWLLFVAVLLSAVATFITRATPFYLMKSKGESRLMSVIQKYMGLMIMVILVSYGLKDVKFSVYPYGAAEILAFLSAIITHLKLKNMLLTISISTAVYMSLLRVFTI